MRSGRWASSTRGRASCSARCVMVVHPRPAPPPRALRALHCGPVGRQVYVDRYFSLKDKDNLQSMIGEVQSPTPRTSRLDGWSSGG